MNSNQNNIKKDYFWNTLGSGVYALASMVLAFAAMHITGPDDGGIFGFGFSAFGQQMFIIAYFGIRPFHITDAGYEYSYNDYRILRILTSLAAVVSACLYLVFMTAGDHYSARKAAIVFLLSLYKIADGVADLYESECQRAGCLWLGGKELCFRTVISAGVLVLAMLLTKDVLKASAAAVAAQAICILWFRQYFAAHVLNSKNADTFGSSEAKAAKTGSWRSDQSKVRQLANSTILLFLSVFVDFYIFSASKYAIDMYLTDVDSGIFNILFMPTSVIYLAANFIIKPYMTRLSVHFEEQDFSAFNKIFGKLKLAVLVMSAAAMLGTILLGKPVLYVLELLLGSRYSGMLTSASLMFVLIILGGCFYAVTNLYYYILIIMRQQKRIFRNYLIIAVAAAVLSNLAVPKFGLMGAACVYPLYMGLITVCFAWTTGRMLHQTENSGRTD